MVEPSLGSLQHFFLLDIEVLDSDEGLIVRRTVWNCVDGRS